MTCHHIACLISRRLSSYCCWLTFRCRELNAEIVANASKVQTALKLSQEDQNTIASLKREIEKAWKMVDASHEKEARAKETIQQLKTEIANLSRLVEQGAGLSVGQENTVNEVEPSDARHPHPLSALKPTPKRLPTRFDDEITASSRISCSRAAHAREGRTHRRTRCADRTDRRPACRDRYTPCRYPPARERARRGWGGNSGSEGGDPHVQGMLHSTRKARSAMLSGLVYFLVSCRPSRSVSCGGGSGWRRRPKISKR